MHSNIRKSVAAAAVVAVLALTGCSTSGGEANDADKADAAEQLSIYQKSQPVPKFEWSQLRQNLIELQTSQAETTATTTFFFNMGIQEPVNSCPSIGFPIPATYQLTNPDQMIGPRESRVTIAQLEATGVFTADTTGTYVMCVSPSGDVYAVYWEGFVQAITGAAEYDPQSGTISLIGEPTFDFSDGNG